MIEIQHNTGNLIEITVTDALQAEDFTALNEKADAIIKKHQSVRVLVDVSNFSGWKNLEAAEQHFGFVKGHHEKVERLAIIAGHMWQHWLAALGQVFLHPEVKVFDKDKAGEARKWVVE